MTEQAINTMDKVVQIVYTPDQAGLAEAFVEMLDAFAEFIQRMQDAGYSVSMDKSLMELQDSFQQRDYVRLTDCILYDLKPDFESLDVE
ncbi:MAG: hypothetical protein K2M46_02920 [Lachnospiraceae bacterium]|nr:hypothetical protein [Lachnospiraceae bacterium]